MEQQFRISEWRGKPLPETNKTVVKAVELLYVFLDHPQLTLQELVNLTSLPKTSVHRMVTTLEEAGFLRRSQTGVYELGLAFLQFGHAVTERLDIRRMSLPVMQRLKEEIGEAVNLIIRDGDEAIYVEKVDTNEPVRVYTAIGRRAPMYAGACPRILLAHLPRRQREQYLETVQLEPIANNTITDKEVLRRVLEEARQTGYTVSHSELANFTSAVASPIFDHTGQVVAGLSIVGPENRFQAEHLPRLILKTKSAAQEISAKLGWNKPLRGGVR
ncbi:IclR family transcriptional regulator [Brevibacillus sp. H7]|uniref:IclR family transcriptional regulator n=1 Tax=Brevibacillus sp. H7 TaxID=3349138 RepID=UPI00380740EA